MTMRWLVETQTAMYHLDFGDGTVVRERLEGVRDTFTQARLRKDEAEIELLSVERCQVGRPMTMLLQIRDDGVMTVRETTPVVRIVPVN